MALLHSPGLLHFTLDPDLIMLSVIKMASSTIFSVIDMIQPGIKPRSSRLLVNILLIKPIADL